MSRIKEIFCLHHSHLDVGYTHPQSMLMELQCDYIDQAIDLCQRTLDWPEESRYRWTCEASWPLEKWLETAGPKRLESFRRLVLEGYISVTALPMHTTPGCTARQLAGALSGLDRIRQLSGSAVTCAVNHDVNGQPWTLCQLLLESSVAFYLTGINIHFGGIPFQRPSAFLWESADGRALPCFLGEHYSLFSQFFGTESGDLAQMRRGVEEYVARMEKQGWQEDYLFLTATNPPMYDNNCPDAGLADMIRRYNREGHEQTIRFVTPEMLYERICQGGLDKLKRYKGDWTDYWNFGAASTPMEVKISRFAKNNLYKADFLAAVSPAKGSKRLQQAEKRAYENALLFDEHTWGSWDSVSNPEGDAARILLSSKKQYAYQAAELSAYALDTRIEEFSANPFQADHQDGLTLINPTAFCLEQELEIPADMCREGRKHSAIRMRDYLPYDQEQQKLVYAGRVRLAPFCAKRIPFSALKPQKTAVPDCFTVSRTLIETPFYRIRLRPETGRILQIEEKGSGRRMLNTDSEWGFFDLVEERVDGRYAKNEREAIFERDVDLGNRSISQWKNDWKAVRSGVTEFVDFQVKTCGYKLELFYTFRSESCEWLKQRVTFWASHDRIGLDASFKKRPDTNPEGIYFTFPLKLAQGWNCVYDTMDTFVRLDEEQLGAVCRDYITVDKSISMFDATGGYTLACPDAPMVMAGDFWFGRENKCIERKENPLLLAWPFNNYWNTNFAASAEGRLSFHYEISPFAEFKERRAYEAGMLAAGPCIVGAAIDCAAEEETVFLECTGEESAPLFLYPCQDENGFMAAVKNFTHKKAGCTIRMPGRTIKSAEIVDVQGRIRRALDVSENEIVVEQEAAAITFLRICLK